MYRFSPTFTELLPQPSIWALHFCKVTSHLPKLWFSVAIPHYLNKIIFFKKIIHLQVTRTSRSWWFKQSYCLILQIRPSAYQRERKHWVTLKVFIWVRNHSYVPEFSHSPFALQGKQGTYPYCICSTGSQTCVESQQSKTKFVLDSIIFLFLHLECYISLSLYHLQVCKLMQPLTWNSFIRSSALKWGMHIPTWMLY